jgi:hypothetical protein
MFKTPLQNLVLDVFLATSLAGFAAGRLENKQPLWALGDVFCAAAMAGDARGNYRKIKADLGNSARKAAPSI